MTLTATDHCSEEKKGFVAGLDLWIRSHEFASVCIVVAVLISGPVCQAITAPMWFDEFFTLFVSRLPTYAAMLHAMPADGQPPLQYWLTHWSLQFLGGSVLALRFPELLAAVASALVTYRIVRLHGSPAQALFGCCMVLGGTLDVAAFNARPYSLLFFFTAVGFYSWQNAARLKQGRLPWLAGVSLGVAGAVVSHHLGIIQVGVFLAAGEAARLFRNRRLDTPVMLAVFIGLSPLIITAPLARQSHQTLGTPVLHAANFWAHPGAIDLLTYVAVSPVLLLILLSLSIMALSPPQNRESGDATPPVPVHEWAAVFALSLLVPIQILFAAFFTNYFQTKYAIGAGLGLALLVSWGIRWVAPRRYPVQTALRISLVLYLVAKAAFLVVAEAQNPVWRASGQFHVSDSRPNPVSPLLVHAPGSEPIVVANAYDYLPEWWYASPDLQKRLTYLADPDYAVQQTDFLPELSLSLDRGIVPAPVADYSTFINRRKPFLLFCSGEERLNWLPSRLRARNWTLRLLSSDGKAHLYEADFLPVTH